MMAIGPNVEAGRNRRIGQYEVDLVHRQIRDQPLKRSFTTHEADGSLQSQRRLE
jgi:hypothetical protein